ncbi:hypothetical protein [Amphritea sp. HPY]|uniref:hypothetical protein n=1 Tax=Amphritea sp. HPY TaxID=3421652 RepID=UPI003D7E2539
MSEIVKIVEGWFEVTSIKRGSRNGLILELVTSEKEIELAISSREVVRYFPRGVQISYQVDLWGCEDNGRFVLGNIKQVFVPEIDGKNLLKALLLNWLTN